MMPLFTHSSSLPNSKLLNLNPQSVFYVYNICIPNAQNCELSAPHLEIFGAKFVSFERAALFCLYTVCCAVWGWDVRNFSRLK